MAQHVYRVTVGGHDYDVSSESELTDAQAYQAALAQAEPSSAAAPAAEPSTSLTDRAVNLLPAAGAIAGGIVGGTGGTAFGMGVGGYPGMVGGTAVGGAAGEAAKQLINRARGAAAPASATEAARAIGSEAAQDAAGAAVLGAAGKVAGAAAPVVGRGLEAAGGAVEAAGKAPMVKWGTKALAAWLGFEGKPAEFVASLTIPTLTRGAGRVLQFTGQALQREAPEAVPTVAERLARIPIAGRLEQISQQAIKPKLTVTEAKAMIESLPDDVALIRASVSKGLPPDTAIKIAASGSAEYADALRKGFAASLKTEGPPIPQAVQDLLKSGAFSKLPSDAEMAATIAKRKP